jgi:1,3-beta-glucanosyltransferase GAS1
MGTEQLVRPLVALYFAQLTLWCSYSRWCGTSGSIASSYQESITAFSNLPVASYFSEYGCNTDTPRTWTEVAAIYGTQMSAVYSGGVAFSYFPTNDAKSFGMVTVDGNTVTTSDDFTNLATALTAVTVLTTPAQGAATTPTLPSCPAVSANWLGSTDVSTRSLFCPRLLKYHSLASPNS